MHRPIFEDRIVLDKKTGEICRVVNARSNQKIIPGLKKGEQTSFDCFKEYETMTMCRNLYINYYNQLGVEFPRETVFNYKLNKKVKRGYDEWDSTDYNINLETYFEPTVKELDIICNKYPAFKYVLKKWSGTRSQIMKVLKQWKVHPEIELPLSLGFYDVCFTKQFFKLNKDDLKKLYKVMAAHKNANYGITELLTILKHGEMFTAKFKSCCRQAGYRVKADDVNWMWEVLENEYGVQRGCFSLDYKDYKQKCEFLNKDMTDEYWKHPTHFRQRLGELRVQYQELKDLEEHDKRLAKMEKYTEQIKKYLGLDKNIGGYDIVVPTTLEQWEVQARKLNQCILRLDYLDRINDNYVLIFIYKDGEPVATCEIDNWKEKKIGQFYGNEEDRNNCYPAKEVQDAMHEWLDELAA